MENAIIKFLPATATGIISNFRMTVFYTGTISLLAFQQQMVQDQQVKALGYRTHHHGVYSDYSNHAANWT